MEDLMIFFTTLTVFVTIYKLFELYAGRRERMMLLEKLGDKLTPDTFKKGILYRPSLFSFNSLRVACLLLGVGLGLLVGYVIIGSTQPEYFTDDCNRRVIETVSVIYGASVLLGGGLGLLISYLVEMKNVKRLDKME